MGEVSCTAFSPLLEWLDDYGISAEPLVEGTGYDLAFLRRRHARVPWDDYAEMADRFERLAGGPHMMRAVGSRVLDAPGWSQLGRVAGMLVHPKQLFAILHHSRSWSIFGDAVDSSFRELPDGCLEMQLFVREPYRPCLPFFRICEGSFPQIPCVFGWPPAAVDATIGERSARYVLTLAARRKKRRRRHWLDRARARLWGARVPLDEMARQALGLNDTLRDLTKAKRELQVQADALRQSEAWWRGLLDSAPDYVLILDIDGTVRYANRTAPSVPDLRGRKVQEFAGDRLPVVEAALREVAKGHVRQTEAPWTAPDGEVCWFSTRYAPIVERGRVTGAVVVARDITSQRRNEQHRRDLEHQLLEAQKVESLGLLAGGVAHDFNNLVMGMMGNAGLAAMEVGPESPAAPYLERVEAGGLRAAALVEQMLDFAGRRERAHQPVMLGSLISEMEDLLATAQPGRDGMAIEQEPDLPAVEGDPARLQQVVMNLITNAAEAAGNQGQVQVRVRRVVKDGEPWVLLEVKDDGPGMDETVRKRMFDPFFTTRGSGRGLGLSAVQGIVQSHGGDIQVDSQAGQGTLVQVWLPGTTRDVPGPQRLAVDERHCQTGRVLVVDDELLVREATAQLLRRHGFKVDLVGEGEAALAWLETASADLIVLDVSLPGRSGIEIMHEIRQRWPKLPILLTSARLPEALDEIETYAGFLRKPYPARRLIEMVRATMARCGSAPSL